MATYTSNYGWTKPSGSDNVDISVLNDNLDDQDSTIHDAFLNMAPPFSESSTYAVDDIVLYGTGLYKCHTAVVTPGSWTGSTNWQVYKLSEGGGGGGGTSNYNDLTNKPSINGVTLSGNKTTSDLGITASEVGAIPSTDKGANGGVATLGNDGIVPSSQLPTMFDGDYNSLTNKPTLGTAAAKDVPSAGNASLTEVVMGSDSRLSDDRNAKDVYSWAKAATKPTYTATEVGAIPSTDKGANGGVAELDSNGKVPSSQLPSYVDDVLSYASQSAFPATGETGKIYIAEDTNKTYRWSGSAYAEISASLALGETSSTAYRGDRGKVAYDHSQLTSGNPHNVSKTDVGLGNVPNVSTNDQEPTFTEASTRNNIASGEKLSVILGKIQKFFNDLKTVAFSGSYADLSSIPSINSNTLSGNKTTSDLGINADNVMLSDGVTSVEDKLTDIGTVVPIIGAGNVQVPNNSVTLIASKSLTKGVYLINIIYNWNSNSSGIREIIYDNDDSVVPSPSPARRNCISTGSHSGGLYHNGVFVIQVINTKTVYFWAYQNSGTSLNVYPYIDAIKLQ